MKKYNINDKNVNINKTSHDNNNITNWYSQRQVVDNIDDLKMRGEVPAWVVGPRCVL